MDTTRKPADLSPKTASDLHRYSVFADEEFISDIASLTAFERTSPADDRIPGIRAAISDRFWISVADIKKYQLSQVIYLEHQTSSATLDMNLQEKAFSIVFSPHTTRAELLEQWLKFEVIRESLFPVRPTKRKPPENPKLLYAVFKERQRGHTFAEIFERYQTGKLQDYTGSTVQHSSEDSLEAYYHKFAPSDPNA